MIRRSLVSATLAVASLGATATACSDQAVQVYPPGSDPVAATTSTLPPGSAILSGQPMPTVRCQLNRAAGPIVFLTNHSFAASAGIIEVIMAKSMGLYDQLCLDVSIQPSFAIDNYAKIAADKAQFAAAGSFSEIVDFAGRNDAKYVALTVDGRVPLDQLMVRPGVLSGNRLSDLEGRSIGVHGAINPAVAAMLDQVGLTAQEYKTVVLDTFDPVRNFQRTDIVGLSGAKSDAAMLLEDAGITYQTFDPATYGVAGSFGVIFTSATFIQRAPTAVEDFIRATIRGLNIAMERPDEAADETWKLLAANGNDLKTTQAVERRRWQIESELIRHASTSEEPLGVPLIARLTQAVATYASIGLFGGIVPDIDSMVAVSLVKDVYGPDGLVIWPSSTGAS